MKILHIVAGVWIESGGLAELVLRFCMEHARAGHDVSLVFLDKKGGMERHPGLSAAHQAGVKVVTFGESFPRCLFFSWGMLFGLGRVVKTVDVVHVHSNWTFPVWCGSFQALRHGKVLAMSPQGCFDPVRLDHSRWKKKAVGWIDRWLLRRADVIHATCEAEKTWIIRFTAAKQNDPIEKRIVVIPNGIDVEHLS